MKLSQLIAEKKEKAGQSTLAIIQGGKKYIFLADPVTGEVERREIGRSQREGVNHGLGAVCD